MIKNDKKTKIIRIISYVSIFCAVLISLNLYKDNIYPSGTDNISLSMNSNTEESGIEVINESTNTNMPTTETAGVEIEASISSLPSNYYSFEKDFEMKESPKVDKQTIEATEKVAKKIEEINEEYYMVKRGDTILKISRKTGQDMNVLVSNNPQLANGKLKIGDKLKILSQNGVYYTIKKGDTLKAISAKYKVDSGKIRETNSIKTASIKAGDKIFIPNPDLSFIDKERAEKLKRERLAKQKKQKQIEMKLAKQKIKELRSRELKIVDAIKKEKTKNRDSFGWPMEWHGVASPFGTRFHPIYGKYIFHKGVDLKAENGTSLYAPQDGVVSFAGWMGGYGKLIIIKHSDGYSTRFGHLSNMNVEEGENVKKGQLIGESGETGNVTGPHLHYEVRKNEVPVNPMSFR